MMKLKNENLNKSFLIYGLGKTGISSFKYLNKKNKCFIFDDNKKKTNKKLKNYFISKSSVIKKNFDNIIISPGINIGRCKLSAKIRL